MDPIEQSPILSGSQMPPIQQQETAKSSVGPIAGTIIIILLLVAGGLYFWGAQLNSRPQSPAYIPSDESSMMQESSDTQITSDTGAGLPEQSSSDDVSSIQSDANAMDVEQMDAQNSAEMNNI